MTWTMPQQIREQPMYHLSGGRIWFEDSMGGILEAEKQGCASIDLNMNWSRPDPRCVICKPLGVACQGHEWDTHWLRPLQHGWVDPLGKIPHWKTMHRMSTAEIQRIHPAGHPSVHIQLMDVQIRRLSVHNLNGSLEAKGRYGWTRARMQRLMDSCVRHQVPALVKSAYTAPLRTARAVGFHTRYTRDHRPGM